MNLVWTFTARADRKSIREQIAADNRPAAIRLDEQFSRRAHQLLAYPMMGRTGRVPETRELLIRPSYILIYQVEGETIRILRVLHTAQQWPPEAADA